MHVDICVKALEQALSQGRSEILNTNQGRSFTDSRVPKVNVNCTSLFALDYLALPYVDPWDCLGQLQFNLGPKSTIQLAKIAIFNSKAD